jgi:hypothetical protein
MVHNTMAHSLPEASYPESIQKGVSTKLRVHKFNLNNQTMELNVEQW